MFLILSLNSGIQKCQRIVNEVNVQKVVYIKVKWANFESLTGKHTTITVSVPNGN